MEAEVNKAIALTNKVAKELKLVEGLTDSPNTAGYRSAIFQMILTELLFRADNKKGNDDNAEETE